MSVFMFIYCEFSEHEWFFSFLVALLIKKEPVDQTVAKGDRVEFSCEPKLMNSDDQPDTRWWYEAFPSSSPQPVEKVIAAKQQQQRIELMALTNSSDDANLELKPPRIKVWNTFSIF